MKIVKYSSEYEKVWDEFIANSKNGTVFHTRKFLSYHKNKFKDESVLIYKKNRLIGVFPAIEWDGKIISHKGSTYGGLIVRVKNTLSDNLVMWGNIVDYYQNTIEFRKSEYIFDKYPSREVIFAAKKLGFKEVNEELSTCLDLEYVKLSERRKRAIKKCADLKIVFDDMNYEKYYEILSSNLKIKYNTTPTHTLDEMKLLKELLPHNYLLVTIYKDSEMIAGIWLVLATDKTAHTFYIAQNYAFSEMQGLSCVVKNIIEYLQKKGFKYLNFGISTENAGEFINKGLFEFKESFGGFGVSRFYFRREA